MNTVPVNIAKGDTSPVWLFGHADANGDQVSIAANYTCAVAVEGTGISRAITDKSADNLYFLVSLSAAETASLTEYTGYRVGMQLTNSVLAPPLVKEEHVRIFIGPNVVA